MDEDGIVIRNKARLVVKRYTQDEGMDYDETYVPIHRLEAIRMVFAFTCYKDFKLFQINVINAFLNAYINEEVYVEQPLSFEKSQFENHVFKLSKALYGLKQDPIAWYEMLTLFLLK